MLGFMLTAWAPCQTRGELTLRYHNSRNLHASLASAKGPLGPFPGMPFLTLWLCRTGNCFCFLRFSSCLRLLQNPLWGWILDPQWGCFQDHFELGSFYRGDPRSCYLSALKPHPSIKMENLGSPPTIFPFLLQAQCFLVASFFCQGETCGFIDWTVVVVDMISYPE